jgi:transposase
VAIAAPAAAAAAAAAPLRPAALFPQPHGKHLTPLERGGIVTLALEGHRLRDISSMINVSQPTVRRWKRSWEETGDVADSERSGRPRLTDELMDTAILGESHNSPFASPRELRNTMQLDLSARTIARRLDENGLHARVAHRQFHLQPAHRAKRLSFAEGYKHWSEDDWCRVLFADEKLFWGEGHSGRAVPTVVVVQQPPGLLALPEVFARSGNEVVTVELCHEFGVG